MEAKDPNIEEFKQPSGEHPYGFGVERKSHEMTTAELRWYKEYEEFRQNLLRAMKEQEEQKKSRPRRRIGYKFTFRNDWFGIEIPEELIDEPKENHMEYLNWHIDKFLRERGGTRDEITDESYNVVELLG